MKDNVEFNPNNTKKRSRRRINIIIAVLVLILAASILNYYSTKFTSKNNNVTNALNEGASQSQDQTTSMNKN